MSTPYDALWLEYDDEERSLPKRVVVGANGAYYRDFGGFYSMCPVSDDNDPVEVVAVYVRICRGDSQWEDA
jgi:hypothetical protein